MTTKSLEAVDVIFIYGALRSGTTMFRLMLNAHPDLSNPGEVDFLFDHLHQDASRADGWRYDIDALRNDRIFHNFDLDAPDGIDGLALLHHMLSSFDTVGAGVLTLNVHRHAAKIALALPKARFVHLLRDPRDVARSSIGMGWSGNSYYGVYHWIKTETGWGRAVIADNQVMTLGFETLMANVEPELTRVCDFLGVPFDAEMLEYHQGTNFGPPDPKIAYGWRRKASDREVALIEGRVGSLLIQRGYEPNGTPRHPGHFEAMFLAVENRWKRWRFNMKRFGAGLFLKTHIARLLGMTSVYQGLRQQQEAIRTARRK